MSILLDAIPLLRLIRPPPEGDPLTEYIRASLNDGKRIYVCAITHGMVLRHIDSLDSADKPNAKDHLKTALKRFGHDALIGFEGRSVTAWVDLCAKNPPDSDIYVEDLLVAAVALANTYEFVTTPAEWHKTETRIKYRYL